MKSQTERRSDSPRPTRSAKTQRYTRQTARVEARRDGRPLVFGWGGHLSRSEKIQFQRRAIWSTAIAITVLIVAVVVGYWVNINVITPGLPITSVNGHAIPQSDYRKLLALKAQLELNKLNGPHGLLALRDDLNKQALAQQKIVDNTTKQIDDLKKKIKALPAGTQRTDYNNQLTAAQQQLDAAQTKRDTLGAQYQQLNSTIIPQEQQFYNQSQLGNDSASWLQDNEFIHEWLDRQNSAIQAKVEPSTSAINRAVNDFAANLPKSTSYNAFLSNDRVSDNDVHAMIALKLRRDNMQTYLASLITSPDYQVLARAMTIATPGDAQKILKQLKQGADFGKLAKDKSVDTNTNTKGGSLGWLSRGQYAQNEGANISAVVDNWIFDPTRKLDEFSPVLSENGSYHIVQILSIDPSRQVDATTLKSLQDNALTTWILEQKALRGATVMPIDQNKLLDAMNIPPGLPLSAPGQQPGAGGLPGGAGGLPGQP